MKQIKQVIHDQAVKLKIDHFQISFLLELPVEEGFTTQVKLLQMDRHLLTLRQIKPRKVSLLAPQNCPSLCLKSHFFQESLKQIVILLANWKEIQNLHIRLPLMFLFKNQSKILFEVFSDVQKVKVCLFQTFLDLLREIPLLLKMVIQSHHIHLQQSAIKEFT